VTLAEARAQHQARKPTEDPAWLKALILTLAIGFIAIGLILPLATVFTEALRKGVGPAIEAISQPDAIAAIKLTLLTAAITVPFNAVFGVCAAWAISKHHFKGKAFLITLIDLPFSVSPVVAGLMFMLIFGLQGWFGGWLADHHIRIMFAVPAIFIPTVFVVIVIVKVLIGCCKTKRQGRIRKPIPSVCVVPAMPSAQHA